MIPSLLLALALTVSHEPPPSDVRALAARFVAALQSESLVSFEPLAADGTPPQSWWSLKETIDRNRCIVVDAYAVYDAPGLGANTWRVEINGWGEAVGERRVRTPLPSSWLLTTRDTATGLRIADAATAEYFAANAIVHAGDDRERQAILNRDAEISASSVLKMIFPAMQATYRDSLFADQRRWDAVEFGLAASQERGRDDAESVLLSGFAYLTMIPAWDKQAPMRFASAAVDAARRSGDCDTIESARFVLANAMAYGGDVDGARRLADEVAAQGDGVRDGRIPLKAQYNVSHMDLRAGDLRAALEGADRLVEKSRASGWREGEVVAAFTLADIQSAVGSDLAALHWRRVLAARLEILGNREWGALALAEMAESDRKLGRMKTATGELLKAIELAKSVRMDANSVGAMLTALGSMYLESGAIADAEHLLDEADARVGSIPFQELEFLRASIQFARGQYDLALHSVTAAAQQGDEDLRWRATTLAGRCLRQLRRTDQAIDRFKSAIALIEAHRAGLRSNELGRSRYFEDKVEPYRELIDLYVAIGRSRDALQTAESLKARVLLDTLTFARNDVTVSLTSGQEERREFLSKRLEEINRRVLALRNVKPRTDIELEQARRRRELEEFDAEMGVRHPIGAGVQAATISPDLEALVPTRDVAAIEFVVTPHATIAFVVARDEQGDIAVHAKRIPVGATELSKVTQQLRDAIARRDDDRSRSARRAYQLLLSPIDKWVRSKKLLLIVPDGPLWLLPFQVLRQPSGAVLIQRSAIAYSPSLTAMGAARAHRGPPRTLLAMGDAKMKSDLPSRARGFRAEEMMGRLPDAADEVRAIAAEYHPRGVAYLEDAATETTFKSAAANYRVLHLATHGVADSEWPMYSAIFLTPTAEDDGILEAREVADMKLNADLVVLSACDTARGMIRSGEGVIGLSWAFLLAGCPTTTVSQWTAESKATSRLMVEFHRQLVRGLKAPEALRRAELTLMKSRQYYHSYYWAPFIILGAP